MHRTSSLTYKNKMNFNEVCRVCLSTESLQQIFSDLCEEHYTKTLYNATGISIAPNDGLPQKICVPCSILLENVIEFRRICHQTETRLLELKNGLKQTGICDEVKAEPKVNVKNEIKSEDDNESDSEDDQPLQCYVNNEQEIRLEEGSQENNCKNQYDVQNDMKKRKGSNITKVKCNFCGRLLSARSIKGHMKRKHCNVMNLKCENCEADFECKESYLEHESRCKVGKRRKHTGSSKELRECDVCKKIMQKASLKMHKAIKHSGLGPVCEHCGRRFGNKYRLNEHYRAKHGYDKYKCTSCEFQSASVTALRNHERRHRGEKPFICETCGAKFHASYLLVQHKQSHRTEKLVKCDLCPATFKANNSLHMHKISCHSSSQYKCTMCSRTYSCRHYAVKHIRQVHGYRGPVPPLQKVPVSCDNEV